MKEQQERESWRQYEKTGGNEEKEDKADEENRWNEK